MLNERHIKLQHSKDKWKYRRSVHFALSTLKDISDKMVATTRRINHEVDGSDNHFSDVKGVLIIVVCYFYAILLFVLASLITKLLSSVNTIVTSKVSQMMLANKRSETILDFNHNVKKTLPPARATRNG